MVIAMAKESGCDACWQYSSGIYCMSLCEVMRRKKLFLVLLSFLDDGGERITGVLNAREFQRW